MLHVNFEFARGVEHISDALSKKKSSSMHIQFPNTKLVKCNVGNKFHSYAVELIRNSYAVEVSILNNHYSRINSL